jgi:hypothetical protein
MNALPPTPTANFSPRRDIQFTGAQMLLMADIAAIYDPRFLTSKFSAALNKKAFVLDYLGLKEIMPEVYQWQPR